MLQDPQSSVKPNSDWMLPVVTLLACALLSMWVDRIGGVLVMLGILWVPTASHLYQVLQRRLGGASSDRPQVPRTLRNSEILSIVVLTAATGAGGYALVAGSRTLENVALALGWTCLLMRLALIWPQLRSPGGGRQTPR
jgi:hypothetical protein